MAYAVSGIGGALANIGYGLYGDDFQVADAR